MEKLNEDKHNRFITEEPPNYSKKKSLHQTQKAAVREKKVKA